MTDLRHALRGLLLRPGFALTAILALSLVTAAATATFAILNAVILRPLSYPSPAELVAVDTTRREAGPESDAWSSGPDFRHLRAGVRAFGMLEAVSPEWTLVVQDDAGAERTTALFVSPGLFQMLGARPAQGRLLTEQDDTGRTASVVVSHAYWHRKLRGQPGAVGSTLRVEGRAYTVVGVMERGFRLQGLGVTSDIDLWLSLSLNPMTQRRQVRLLKLAGRLAPGTTLERATTEVQAFQKGLAEKYPDTNQGLDTRLRPLSDAAFGRVRLPLLLLMAFVVLLLAVACANVANLVLARGLSRSRETAVRLALGASARQVVRLWTIESLLLGVVGGAIGAGLAGVGLRWLAAMAPDRLPRRQEIAFDVAALTFALAAALGTSLLSALAPAFQLLRSDLRGALAQGGRGTAAGSSRLRGGLMTAEIALALVLLIGAGLLLRSFVELNAVDPGFRAAGLSTVSLSLPADLNTPAKRAATYREIRDRVRAVPGVADVAAVSRLPLVSGEITSFLEIEGRPVAAGQQPEVGYRVISENYMTVMGIPLRRGRLLNERDEDHPQDVLLINETLGKRYFAGEDPVGKRVRLGGNGPWIEIVGVVGDVRHAALDADPRPEIYRPYGVNPLGSPALVFQGSAATISGVRAAVRGVNAGIPVYKEMTMEMALAKSAESRRFPMLLAGAFAVIAMGLALVGLHGVLSQWALERRGDFAVRMALGASPGGLARLVLMTALRMTLAGLGAGLLVSGLIGRWMKAMVFGVSPFDPLVYLAAPIGLVLVVLAASAIPGWRATRLSPMEVLRQS